MRRLKKLDESMLKVLLNEDFNRLDINEYNNVCKTIGKDVLEVLGTIEEDGHTVEFFRTVHPTEIGNEYFVYVNAPDIRFVSNILDLKYDSEIGLQWVEILVEGN